MEKNMAGAQTSPLRKKVLKLMEDEGTITITDLIEKLGMSNGSARSLLVKMKQAGLVERTEPGTYKIAESS